MVKYYRIKEAALHTLDSSTIKVIKKCSIFKHLNNRKYVNISTHEEYYIDNSWMVEVSYPESSELMMSFSLQTKLERLPDNPVARALVTMNRIPRDVSQIRNLHLKKDGVLSFCPAGKDSDIVRSSYDLPVWSIKDRQEGKYGKVIKKVLADDLTGLLYTDSELEEVVNLLKATTTTSDFRIVYTEDIRFFYSEDNINDEQNLGSLGGSCMKYESCQDFLDIYV